jgi:transketolase
MLNEIPAQTRGKASGGVAISQFRREGELPTILLSCGSELQHAIAAAKNSKGVRVVSMPCFERFEAQKKPTARRCSQLMPPTVAIERVVKDVWYRYVGLDGV